MPTIGLRSAKHQARQDAQRDVVRKGDAFQAEALRADDTNPAAEVQRFVQSTDEMAAALTQFRNRRDYDKKLGHLADSFERVLDEEAQSKAQQIIQVANAHRISVAELLRQVRTLFPDDSDLVLVLHELLRRRQMEEVVRKRLQALLKQVEDRAEPKLLKAGINCALKARLFGKALQLSPGLLRASYRQFLQSEAREVDVYADWIGSYGYQRRATVLDFMEGALLADIDSQDASCSRLEFGYLLGRLGQLKLLRSSDAVFVGGLLANENVCEFNGNEADWLLFLLSLLQLPQELDALLADVVGRSALLRRHGEHSILLQALYRACKALSPTLFVDAHWQDTLLEDLRRMANIAYEHERIERRRESG
ncbi:YopN/LcrE/InvE/MxiC type III secretion system gatekeeper [Burkholderia ubonensis]|uniref:Type III secretion system regulator InvE n=2 Tax=Burkholderia ubonensis TaxID=101571 RepID=A0A106UR67_9BURK|nr:YopN/LcrE/InvE/MxiC type III secretion system gatekeeper [Burkholderia ubonensis]KVZ41448.1 type III secretion system regulator InvE [Burkholderia ubonensis]KWA68548.1 type III secretion system regulator InvE [Burkholderia ubonensis]KWB96045.1 type III secretion system regulator InvE [Burkholderia ubonensis]KWZ58323.1 type III secretion system regulator InvE [Burkholderia ubonensis]